MNNVNSKLMRGGGCILQPQPERRKGYLNFSSLKNLLQRRFNVRGGLIE
jgi:hypothetical protein